MALNENKQKTFLKLMINKVSNILLISSAYDAFIMEEDGRLTERIISEYEGLNLSNPPIITWAKTAKNTFEELKEKKFDIIIAMPRITDMNYFELSEKIKKKYPKIPIFMLAHDNGHFFMTTDSKKQKTIERTFVWRGNTDLLLALIKSTEDKINADFDCNNFDVKTIIFVEDSPLYRASILPMLYKELVLQTQAVIEEALTSEEKLLRMRSRPKILLAESYEEAIKLYKKYKKNLLSIITDVRYNKNGKKNKEAGFLLISKIKKDIPDLEVLVLSSEEQNREKAKELSYDFINKNSETLYADIRYFFMNNLGFGDFVFKNIEKNKVIGRASNILTMYNILSTISSQIIMQHIQNKDFSKWFSARYEVATANEIEKLQNACQTKDIKENLIEIIKKKFEEKRKKVAIIDFNEENFDINVGYSKVGNGSIGGKARGLAFFIKLLGENTSLSKKFPKIKVLIPQSIVITTEGFTKFLEINKFNEIDFEDKTDEEINNIFLNGRLPKFLSVPLKKFLRKIKYPIAVRSSSFLEDAHFRPCAGIYETYMLPNNDEKFEERRKKLYNAVKLVYASIFLKIPQSFFKNTQYSQEEDKMAVLIQELCGDYHKDYFYPLISGVAQSHNFYPNDYMKKEEGVVHIAMGFGKSVVEGERTLRFSPAHPKKLPQFSNVNNILKNAQRFFYALKMENNLKKDISTPDGLLKKLEVEDAKEHNSLDLIASSYSSQDNRIRDFYKKDLWPVLTFANILKYDDLQISKFISKILRIGEKGMATPVEIEFAMDLKNKEAIFYILQIRPMVVYGQHSKISISEQEKNSAFLYSNITMGVSQEKEINNIVYIDEKNFDISKSVEIAAEIGKINALLKKKNEKYLLIGPGRWGSTDKWLGIPVTWVDISEVDTIIENKIKSLNAEPSQGSHFFHNITSLNVNYISIFGDKSFIKLHKLAKMKIANETKFVKHIELEQPFTLKINGEKSEAVVIN